MLNITGQNIELTDAIKQRIQDKFNKLTKRFSIVSANTYISVANKQTRCLIEVTSADYGKLSAEDTSEDFYNTANATFDKLTRQLNDAKEKSKGKGRSSIRRNQSEADAPETTDDITVATA